MDWNFVFFVVEEGFVGLIALAATLPVFAFAATPKRKLWASSSTLVALLFFVTTCVLAGTPGIEVSRPAGYLPLAGLAATVVLIAPSTFSLRWRWFGLLHLLTVGAAAYLCFIGGLAISHDAT